MAKTAILSARQDGTKVRGGMDEEGCLCSAGR
jgi:hypothetical protein